VERSVLLALSVTSPIESWPGNWQFLLKFRQSLHQSRRNLKSGQGRSLQLHSLFDVMQHQSLVQSCIIVNIKINEVCESDTAQDKQL
jgi:hypothetical protein